MSTKTHSIALKSSGKHPRKLDEVITPVGERGRGGDGGRVNAHGFGMDTYGSDGQLSTYLWPHSLHAGEIFFCEDQY